MGTLNAIYVRADHAKAALLKVTYPTAYTEANSDFYAIDLPRDHFDCPTDELRKLSRELETDVLWITFQSTSDSFAYYHWRSGTFLRNLMYGCSEQGMWEHVEGYAERWEYSALFPQRDLQWLLESSEDEVEKQHTRRVYTQGILETGSMLPMVDARESARAIAEYYELPGWH
jgi:hypothetical protein